MRFTTAYAFVPSNGDASTFAITARAGYGRFGIETSFHVLAGVLVSLIRPFVVPTQIVPLAIGDGGDRLDRAGRGAARRSGAVSAGGVIPFGIGEIGSSCGASARRHPWLP